MKKNFKLTENDLNRLVKRILSEQSPNALPQNSITNNFGNTQKIKDCLSATYGKGRNLGNSPQGGLIYNVAGLVTVFYTNNRYGVEYNKTKGSFNCSTGKAVLTPDTGDKPTGPTKPATPTAKPATPTAKPATPTAAPTGQG